MSCLEHSRMSRSELDPNNLDFWPFESLPKKRSWGYHLNISLETRIFIFTQHIVECSGWVNWRLGSCKYNNLQQHTGGKTAGGKRIFPVRTLYDSPESTSYSCLISRWIGLCTDWQANECCRHGTSQLTCRFHAAWGQNPRLYLIPRTRYVSRLSEWVAGLWWRGGEEGGVDKFSKGSETNTSLVDGWWLVAVILISST